MAYCFAVQGKPSVAVQGNGPQHPVLDMKASLPQAPVSKTPTGSSHLPRGQVIVVRASELGLGRGQLLCEPLCVCSLGGQLSLQLPHPAQLHQLARLEHAQ